MLSKRMVLIGGLTLALMAPSIQATGPVEQRIAEIKERYPLTWEQTATSAATGIASGATYGVLLSKGNLFGAFLAMLVMRPLKNLLLEGDLPTDKPSYKMSRQEMYRYYATGEKKDSIDNAATLVAMFGVLAANAATGKITIPELGMPLLTSGLTGLGKIAGVILFLAASI